jgi:hypothetical protein
MEASLFLITVVDWKIGGDEDDAPPLPITQIVAALDEGERGETQIRNSMQLVAKRGGSMLESIGDHDDAPIPTVQQLAATNTMTTVGKLEFIINNIDDPIPREQFDAALEGSSSSTKSKIWQYLQGCTTPLLSSKW